MGRAPFTSCVLLFSQKPFREHVFFFGCGDLRQLSVSEVTVSMMTLVLLHLRGQAQVIQVFNHSALNLRGVCVIVFIHREFQTPYLLCDCHLLWLLEWIKHRSITVKNTKCSFPQSLQAQLVANIRPELLTCGRDVPPVYIKSAESFIICSDTLKGSEGRVSNVWYQEGTGTGEISGCPPSAAFVCTSEAL